MGDSQPFAAWPEQVSFSARELNVILGALELGFSVCFG
jgi:hypothetical protein